MYDKIFLAFFKKILQKVLTFAVRLVRREIFEPRLRHIIWRTVR